MSEREALSSSLFSSLRFDLRGFLGFDLRRSSDFDPNWGFLGVSAFDSRMLGAGPQFGRGHSDDRFYNAAKARRNPNQSFFRPRSLAASSAPVVGVKGKVVVLDGREPENRAGSEPPCKTAAVSSSSSVPEVLPPCNLAQFIKFTSPSVPAQYPSKVSQSWPFLLFFWVSLGFT